MSNVFVSSGLLQRRQNYSASMLATTILFNTMFVCDYILQTNSKNFAPFEPKFNSLPVQTTIFITNQKIGVANTNTKNYS